MKRSIVYAGAGAIVALIALGAWQHFRRPPFGLPPEVRLERRLGRLGLDRAQREKVEVILTAARKGRAERRTQLRQAFEQLHTLLEQEQPDEAAIMRQVDVIGGLKTEQQKAMLHTLLEVRAELTPEQRQKLEADRPRHRRWRRPPPPEADDAE
jgi:Spy/CpxP family protein refolding chaperone